MAAVKTVTVNIKSDGDGLAEGQFTGYASVFGNKDSYGDVVAHGAFAKTLSERGDSPVPIYWQHRTDDPDMNIGKSMEIREDAHGLFVKGQLDLDSAKGAQVHRLIKEKRVSQMSFMYDVVKQAEVDGGPWNGGHMELQELKLHEVSIVPVGANQETELLSVKDGETGRVVAVKDTEGLRAAYKALGLILGVKESDSSEVSDEEPEGSKAEEPCSRVNGVTCKRHNVEHGRESGESKAKAEDSPEVKARKDPDAALASINALTI